MSQRRRITTAVLVAASLIVSGQQAAASMTAPPPTPDKWNPVKDVSVGGQNATPKPGTPDLDDKFALTKTPAAVWPSAGSAKVDLPAAKALLTTATLGDATKAGALPVRVGPATATNRAVGTKSQAAATSATPKSVQVDLIGRKQNSLVLRVSRADGVAKAGPVSLRVDYSAFKYAFGGDWGSRLRLLKLPECALTTPEKAECAGVPVPTVNHGLGELSADVPAAGKSEGLFAVAAGSSGEKGDAGATPLSPTATWEVGGSSGDFNWSYPMKVPPSLGGPKPELGLGYSSGGVDGRTTTSNSQASWAGAGFDLAVGGSIERKYASCGAKSEQKDSNNGTKPTGDLCWATDNSTFSLNGSGGELIPDDDEPNKWHSKADSGLLIERLFGADNGDGGGAGENAGNDGEYWVVTGKDGTKFYFGLNKLPGATSDDQDTHSAWTVPVFGNHPGEPCRAAAFADSHCDQAYRWNLDYVVDAHGNTMSLFYDVETERYARAMTATAVSEYVRAGHLSRIEYGQRDGEVFDQPAVARVTFQTEDRCIGACEEANYPDTPLDLACYSDTDCKDHYNPTFWTARRLASVTTEVADGTEYKPVSKWTLQHTYLKGTDDRAGLWLNGITNTGLVDGTLSTPSVTFASIMKNNRVTGTGLSPLDWPRVKAVKYGNGGELAVNYLDPDCTVPNNLPTRDNNTKRCYPVKWTPQGQQEREDWFGKYVVNQITESDLTSGMAPVVTTVQYLSPPAWHHDDEDGLVQIDAKTWSQWRGYEKLRLVKGLAGTTQSVTENIFYRGMDGDETEDGPPKDAKITDSTGGKSEDLEPLAGQLREQTKYDGTKVVDRTIRDPWVSAPTATRVRDWGTTSAFQVAELAIRQDQATDTGRRTIGGKNAYYPNGMLKEASGLGDTTTTTDDTCTRYEYADSPTEDIRAVTTRQQTVSTACDKPWTNAQVIADERVFYDNNTVPGVVGDKGEPTKVQRLSGFDSAGKPTYQTVVETAFDAIGRAVKTTNADDKSTVTEFSPAGAAPVTDTKVTLPNGQVTRTEFEPAFGTAVGIVDPAGKRSKIELDPLGRTAKAWLTGQDDRATPNAEYEYTTRTDGAGMVTSKTLKPDGQQNVAIELTDGLDRKRETQRPSADGVGRVITEYVYDSRGLKIKENGPYFNRNPIDDKVFVADEAQLPSQQVAEFDNQELPKAEIFVSKQAEQWRTTHSSAAGRATIEPPAGSQATTKLTDGKGRVIELRQYAGPTASGAFDKTTYTYHPAGQLATVTDPAGNVWKFDYDLRGRKIKTQDPDKGTTYYTYNDLDQLVSTKGSNDITLSYTYDSIGRKTALRSSKSGATPTLQAEWKYDTVKAGTLSSSIRYVNGQPYESRVTGYDTFDKPTGTELVIPAAEGDLAGTYPIKTGYTLDGQVASNELPGVGGLPAETLQVGYNAQNLPTTLSGADPYVTGTQFNSVGQTTLVSSGPADKWVQQGFEYDTRTQQLTRSLTKTPTGRVGDLNYKYDASGNVTKITDVAAAGSGETTDTQCFGYDQFRRMTSAWTPGNGDCAATPTKDTLGGPAPYFHSWAFDKTGNRKTETRTTAAGITTSTYDHPADGVRPHALSKVTTTGPGVSKTDSYSYDAEGNMVSRTLAGAGETFTWDAEGHLESATTKAGKTSYIYDADGNRLIRKAPTGTTLTIGQTELLLMPDGSKLGTRYYTHGGQTIAVRVGTTLSWVNADLHGTSTIEINATTQTIQRRRMTPYGEVRGAAPAAWPGDRGFHGGTDDKSTGLVHLGAREYDPTTGRFISVDPVADFDDPQQLNGYAYANNSPITFQDSDGRRTVTTYKTIFKKKWEVIERQVKEIKTIYEKVVTRITKFVEDATSAILRGDIARLRELVKEIVAWIPHQIEQMRTIREQVERTIKEVQKIEKYIPDVEREKVNNTLTFLHTLRDDIDLGTGIFEQTATTQARVEGALKDIEAAKAAADQVKSKEEQQKKIEAEYRNEVGDAIKKNLLMGFLGIGAGAVCGTITVGIGAAACAGLGAWVAGAVGDSYQAGVNEERKLKEAGVRPPQAPYGPVADVRCHAYAMGAGGGC